MVISSKSQILIQVTLTRRQQLLILVVLLSLAMTCGYIWLLMAAAEVFSVIPAVLCLDGTTMLLLVELYAAHCHYGEIEMC